MVGVVELVVEAAQEEVLIIGPVCSPTKETRRERGGGGGGGRILSIVFCKSVFWSYGERDAAM